jgi:hypothetical protein
MNTLAYLATIYIPLTASTVCFLFTLSQFLNRDNTDFPQSIYSMSVLPSAASFQSFFVVFGVLFLLTILLGANLQKMLAWLKVVATRVKPKPRMTRRLGISKKLPVWLQTYLTGYIKILNPYEKHRIPHPVLYKLRFLPVRILFHLSRTGPILFLRHFLLPEICFPYDQYILFSTDIIKLSESNITCCFSSKTLFDYTGVGCHDCGDCYVSYHVGLYVRVAS